MEREIILCKDLISFESLGMVCYSPCNRKTKYKVTFKEGATGKYETRFVCGIHYNSIKSYESRMKKKCDYDVELEVKLLN